MGDLDNKIAVVTGASRGIGRAIAVALSRDGAHVVLNYRKRRESVEETQSEINKIGGNSEIIQADISSYEEVKTLFEKTHLNHGRIDILVSNAAVPSQALFTADLPLEEWNRVIKVNLTGIFITNNCVLSFMRKQRSGVIINISSKLSRLDLPKTSVYSVAKAGVESLTRIISIEEARNGIRANVVAPGVIGVGMGPKFLGHMGDEGSTEFVKHKIPLERVGTSEEVANVVSFLCSNRASYITGEVIDVSGGL